MTTRLPALLALAIVLVATACTAAPSDIRTATVDGHPVAYRVLGHGRPVLVMISGLGDGMASFAEVAPELAKDATVIVYDRPGYGASPAPAGPRDAATSARELSGLLAQSGAPGPYVLLGHSLGGLYAEYYAATRPDQVAGLILEESRPADFTRRCEAAKAGMCTPPALAVRFMPKGAQAEFAALTATMAQVEAAGPVKGKAVLVLSRPPAKGPFDALWTKAQADLAARYPGARHLTAAAGGHYVHRDQRDWFVAAVRGFLGLPR